MEAESRKYGEGEDERWTEYCVMERLLISLEHGARRPLVLKQVPQVVIDEIANLFSTF